MTILTLAGAEALVRAALTLDEGGDVVDRLVSGAALRAHVRDVLAVVDALVEQDHPDGDRDPERAADRRLALFGELERIARFPSVAGLGAGADGGLRIATNALVLARGSQPRLIGSLRFTVTASGVRFDTTGVGPHPLVDEHGFARFGAGEAGLRAALAARDWADAVRRVGVQLAASGREAPAGRSLAQFAVAHGARPGWHRKPPSAFDEQAVA